MLAIFQIGQNQLQYVRIIHIKNNLSARFFSLKIGYKNLKTVNKIIKKHKYKFIRMVLRYFCLSIKFNFVQWIRIPAVGIYYKVCNFSCLLFNLQL